MNKTLAFDVYGTLVDPLSVATELQQHIGSKAAQFAYTWRNKQLEYAFRRGLMNVYKDFSVCTLEALEYCCQAFDTPLSSSTIQRLTELYRSLPAYDDCNVSLSALRSAGCRLYAFSNGLPDDLEELLRGAGLFSYLSGIVSVDDVRTFKPSPAVYSHFQEQARSDAENTWLVSGNAFDVIGGCSSGWNTVWLKRRQNAIFDPWEFEPTTIIQDLTELQSVILR